MIESDMNTLHLHFLASFFTLTQAGTFHLPVADPKRWK